MEARSKLLSPKAKIPKVTERFLRCLNITLVYYIFISQAGRLGQDVLINVGKGTEFVGGNAMMIVVETIAIIHC